MDLRTEIQQRLQAFEKGNLRDNALALLGTLGYASEKRITLSPNNLEQFLSAFDTAGTFRKKEARADDWKSVDFLFQLRARFKGEILTARVRRDGTVRFDGKVYTSPSMAAALACKRRTCNGWTFWQYERAPGDWVAIDKLRK